MPDFASLLSKPADAAKKPPVLNVGDYPGVITSYEPGESRDKKTPFVRFNVKPTGWPDGADPQTKDDGTPIDLSGKSWRRDFYLTDDALWRLSEFLKGLGLEIEGQAYVDLLPQTIGKNVLIELRQYMNTQTNDLGNEVQGLKGVE